MRAASLTRIGLASLLILSVLLLGSGAWASHHWPYRQDRHLFEYMGQRINAGGVIYQDGWDNKPPLLPWINAGVLAISNDSTIAITVAADCAVGITVGALAFGAWVWFGPGIACLLALLAAGTLSLRYYDGCTNGSELYAAMFDSIAVTGFMLSWRARSWKSVLLSILAGLGFAAAFATKQNAVAGLVVTSILLLYGVVRLQGRRAGMLGRLIGLTVGFCSLLGGVVYILERQGALKDAFYAIFTVNKLFVSAGLSWWGWPSSTTRAVLGEQLWPLALLIWLAAIGVVASLVDHRSRKSEPADVHHGSSSSCGLPAIFVLMLAAWFCLAAYSVMWGGCHLTRYWHVTLVPLFWLSGQCLFYVGRTISEIPSAGRLVVVVALATAAWLLARTTIERQYNDLWSAYHYATVDSERARILDVAKKVESLTSPGDAIYVWGYEPGIYRFSHRAAPCRFSELCKVAMLGAPAQFMVDEVIAALTTKKPRLILVTREDIRAIAAGQWARTQVVALHRLIQNDYRETGTVQGYTFFERIDAASRPATGGS